LGLRPNLFRYLRKTFQLSYQDLNELYWYEGSDAEEHELSIPFFHLKAAPLMSVIEVGETIFEMICKDRVYVPDL
jgi:hypothetical protein